MDSQPKKVVESGDVEYWETRWVENRIGWHCPKVSPFLIRNYQIVTGKNLPDQPLIPGSEEFVKNSNKKWYIPLCGKTLDVAFLLSLGYKVFAVEGVRLAIETLDKEHQFGLQFNEQKSVFIGAEGRLEIYFGDLFKCPIEQFAPLDYVWDRGSLIAMEYPFRQSYIKMMQRVLKNPDGKYSDFVYLLETVQYDKTKFGGPPRSVDDQDIEALYKDWTDVKFLEKEPLPADHRIRAIENIGPDVDCRIFLVTPKRN